MSYGHNARNRFVQAEVFAHTQHDQAAAQLAAGLKDLAEAIINIEQKLEQMNKDILFLRQEATQNKIPSVLTQDAGGQIKV